ncbi:MAG: VOC family protein [Candidatus Eremiobacteraeota bacterium]|nr:VOC family protein [Candidatus Eremiobacteraeota bacterium]
MFSRLDHVQLAIPCGGENRAREFYVEVLGFEEVSKPEELAKRGGAWFRSGDVTLHVGVDERFTPATKAHPALRCVDYPALLDRLSRSGIVATSDPILFNGRPHCYIADPFGNRLEMIG